MKRFLVAILALVACGPIAPTRAGDGPRPNRPMSVPNAPADRRAGPAAPPTRLASSIPDVGPAIPVDPTPTPSPAQAAAPRPAATPFAVTPADLGALKSVALIGLASLAPAAVLMFTSFVRINIVLILLRQALGSPQVPGNQVLSALAILLSALVMQPVAEAVYRGAIRPYAAGELPAMAAWEAGSRPVKAFMFDQIRRTDHVDYVHDLYELAEPGKRRPERLYLEDLPLRVVAPAFLLSELTTALKMGFLIYLPFLVVDLVVSAVLSAMGLFMLPPTMVAMPLKLVLFVLADGWMLVAGALVRSFEVAG